MVDCGVGFKKMKEELYKVDILLLTHDHSDHIKKTTLDSIRKNFPRVQIVGNPTVAYKYFVNHIVTENPIVIKGIRILPIPGLHDTEVTCYSFNVKCCDIWYGTDTCEANNPEDTKFDYMFIESNYDERKLNELRKQYTKGSYDPWINAQRHLSTQKAKAFYFMNRKDSESQFIELHKSSRFY